VSPDFILRPVETSSLRHGATEDASCPTCLPRTIYLPDGEQTLRAEIFVPEEQIWISNTGGAVHIARSVRAEDAVGPHGADAWESVVSYGWSLTQGELRATLITSADRLEIVIPRAIGAATSARDETTVHVAVNDLAYDLEASSVRDVVAFVAARDLDSESESMPPPRQFQEMLANLRDVTAFARASTALALVFARTDNGPTFGLPGMSPASCGVPCLECGTSLGIGILSIGAVIVTCSSIPFSSGLSTWACVVSMLNLPLQQLTAMGDCASCAECLQPQPGPGKGDKGSGVGNAGDCPAGTHTGPTTECGGHAPCCCEDANPGNCGTP
jgi:hypothetical protein